MKRIFKRKLKKKLNKKRSYLSSAAILWALSYVVDKMSIVNKKSGIYQGRAIVIGALNPLGRTNAKILSFNWKELVIVGDDLEQLEALKNEINSLNNQCFVKCFLRAEILISKCDLVVSDNQNDRVKVIDIKLVKSGAVVADIGSHKIIDEESIMIRPDIVVMTHAEIGFSGLSECPYQVETELLNSEKSDGTIESFMAHDYQKIFNIDRLARLYGVKLFSIMGYQLEITDEELELCREHIINKKEIDKKFVNLNQRSIL